MPLPTIIPEEDSLKEAIEILDNIFNKEIFEKDPKLTTWKTWYFKQKKEFLDKEVNISTFFASLFRIKDFLENKAGISPEELFILEKQKREKRYDLSVKKKELFNWKTEYITSLTKKLFEYLTEDQNRTIEPNPAVEAVLQQRRRKETYIKPGVELEEAIHLIEEDKIVYSNEDKKLWVLGTLYLDLGDLKAAEQHYNAIPSEKLRVKGTIRLSLARHDFDTFTKTITLAFPETFKPERSGSYIMSFSLLDSWNFKYDISPEGQRCVSIAFSSGICQIDNLKILRTFLEDIREDSVGRTGLWLLPFTVEEKFTHTITSPLVFQRIIGWKEYLFDDYKTS